MATAYISLSDSAVGFAQFARPKHRFKKFFKRGMRVKRRYSYRQSCRCWQTVCVLVNGYHSLKIRPCKHDAGKFLGVPIIKNPIKAAPPSP